MPLSRTPRAVAWRAAALGLAAALALPAAAGAAGRVSSDGTTVHVAEDAAGEQNSVNVAIQQAGIVEVADYGEIVVGAGCTRSETDPKTALCPLGSGGIVVETGGGDDVVGSYYGNGLSLPDGALRVWLGDGRDTFHGNAAAEVVDGGGGNDTLRGAGGDDGLDGGAGDDTLDGGTGRDTVRGGEGDDVLTGDDTADRGIFADLIDGGPGRDTLKDYRSGSVTAAPAIVVTFDGVANDGRAGERDDVRGIEVVLPESPATFTGDDGPNAWYAPMYAAGSTLRGAGGADLLRGSDSHGDAIDGGAGDDDLAGGFGDDTVIGGPGRDTIAGDRPLRCNEVHCDVGGGSGNDTIQARDGEVDSITCGPGTDRVVADAADVVAADCEQVERSSGGGSGGGERRGGSGGAKVTVAAVGTTRLRTALAKGLLVRVRGARTGSRVAVALRLAAPAARKLGLTRGSGAVTVASGSAKAGAGGVATVRLRFTATARRRLATAARVTLTLRTAGAARTVGLKR